MLDHLLGCEIADVGLAELDELDGVVVELLEIVGGVEDGGRKDMIRPALDEPPHILLNGIDVLDLLARGVGIIHAQVAEAGELPGDAEVEANGLAMPDVQVAVGFGRKPGDDSLVSSGGDIRGDDVADEIRGIRFGGRTGGGVLV